MLYKVSSKSNPNQVAGAIASGIKDGERIEMQTIGAGAINQAVKAVAIARGFLAPCGIDLYCMPAFNEIELDGEKRTTINLLLVH